MGGLFGQAKFHGSWTPFTVNKTNRLYDAHKSSEVPFVLSFWQYRHKSEPKRFRLLVAIFGRTGGKSNNLHRLSVAFAWLWLPTAAKTTTAKNKIKLTTSKHSAEPRPTSTKRQKSIRFQGKSPWSDLRAWSVSCLFHTTILVLFALLWRPQNPWNGWRDGPPCWHRSLSPNQ